MSRPVSTESPVAPVPTLQLLREWAVATRRLAMTPAGLWTGFTLVHVVLGLLGLFGPWGAFSDVKEIYTYWMRLGFDAQHWMGIDEPWVYPIVALAPLAIAFFPVGRELFPESWVLLVTVLDLVALGVLIGWGRRRDLLAVGWWWTGFLALLGPIALGRLDSVTVPIAVIAMLILATRPAVASALLTIAAWIKVWPAALLLAIVIAFRRRLRVALAALISTAAICTAAVGLGGGRYLFAFITEQTGRGLQVEAPVATIWLWTAWADSDGTKIRLDDQIQSWEIAGPGTELAAAVMTPILAGAVLALVIIGIVAMRRNPSTSDVLPALSLALVTAFIALNKVGSPQYFTWLAVPVVFGLVVHRRGGASFRVPAILVAAIGLLTQLIYPYFYDSLLTAKLPEVLAISGRDILLAALLAWAVRGLLRAGTNTAELAPPLRR